MSQSVESKRKILLNKRNDSLEIFRLRLKILWPEAYDFDEIFVKRLYNLWCFFGVEDRI